MQWKILMGSVWIYEFYLLIDETVCKMQMIHSEIISKYLPASNDCN